MSPLCGIASGPLVATRRRAVRGELQLPALGWLNALLQSGSCRTDYNLPDKALLGLEVQVAAIQCGERKAFAGTEQLAERFEVPAGNEHIVC
jgi:hypothetical protein